MRLKENSATIPFFLLFSLLGACSTAPKTKLWIPLPDQAELDLPDPDGNHPVKTSSNTRKILSDLNVQVQNLDNKLNLLIQKIEEESLNRAPASRHATKVKSQAVHPAPGENAGTEVIAHPHSTDFDGSFAHDEAIQVFRKAYLFYQSEKYPETILAFTRFLDKLSDHVLAGSAQFYIAQSYFKQNEYGLAVIEFEKLLKTYGRSTHITEALKNMAISEDQIKRPVEAAQHRQMLSQLFPQSPPALAMTTGPDPFLPRPHIQESAEDNSVVRQSVVESLPLPLTQTDPIKPQNSTLTQTEDSEVKKLSHSSSFHPQRGESSE